MGEKGYILGDFMTADVIVGSREDASKEIFSNTRSCINSDANNIYRAQWNEFLRAVRGERKPENPPEQAIVSTLLMHSQIESGKTGREVNIHEIAAKCGYQF